MITRAASQLPGNLPFGSPVGPSAPLRQVYPVLPGISSPVISVKRPTRYGRGVIVPVTAPAATPVLITHNLGRVPSGITALSNDGGQVQNPALTLAAGTLPTRTQATISGDQVMTNCLVWLF